MQRIAINRCHGGFSLSPKAIARLAELKGKKAYFFTYRYTDDPPYKPIAMEDISSLFFLAFSIPNPNEVLHEVTSSKWRAMSSEEREAHNRLYKEVSLDYRSRETRTDPDLLKVIEELGDEANGRCAKIGIVEVPDGVEWKIDEYDGWESIEEVHRSWS